MDQVLLGDGRDVAPPVRLGGRRHGGLGGGLPGGLQLRRGGRGQLPQAVAEMLLGQGQLVQRVDVQQQRAGLLLAHVEDLDLHLHVGVEVPPQVAVDQLQPPGCGWRPPAGRPGSCGWGKSAYGG
jgi:hypothetical protein